MLEDQSFFGFARTGVYNEKYHYPSILDVTNSGEFHLGRETTLVMGTPFKVNLSYPDFINGSTQGILSGELEIIPNGSELIQRPGRLIRVIRDEIWQGEFKKLLYIQGIADPYLIPALVYAGVSFLDDSFIRLESLNNTKYTQFGRKSVDYYPLEENLSFARDIMGLCSESIRSGTLRDLVEKFQVSSKAMELLRVMDHRYHEDMEQVLPSRTGAIHANSIESLVRPDLVRYRSKLINDYVPPPGKVALVIPCSARKPYSASKSHKRLISSIAEFRKYLHEIIVTSPVGVVPRDLEEGYPARYYDIPVIGHWYEDEKSMMSSLVSQYFSHNRYGRVIAFLPEDLEFLENYFPSGSSFIRGEIGNRDDLNSLRERISEEIRMGDDLVPTNRLQFLTSVASYQFGSWIVPKMKDLKRVTNYDFDLLTQNGKVMLVYNPANGRMTINRNAGTWFIEAKKRLVEIDDFKPTANVYAVGVIAATSDIRPEDEVVLVHDGEVRGVGIAKMPFSAMVNLKKGVAVKVRN